VTDVAQLPRFRYHPDPVATGSVEPSDEPCEVCGQARGFVYAGPVYSEIADEPTVCPWCIADGSAARTFDAEFTYVGLGVPDDVPAGVVEEIAYRTPGFPAWQQDHWLYHCGDGGAFLGAVGRADLDGFPDALDCLRHEHDEFDWAPEDVEEYLDSLSAAGSPTAYLFRCTGCGTHLAYSDSD
jgi:uncharacterized protein